ncbi:anti-sigma factor family protein [Gimesia fumaroli]|jgi:predicted anti-sigma-YlaC factor YlaD|uniref:Zinc-finger domain-containing protein n=1 Tax=Gimesia fumaroli TaxID=2527976 RepID=A0A518I7J3_9PLAN|nr:hypothetical protein [Gimesia fumaroli]QDV49066.1 hypothetical protein Enr17x_10810 [Gimesia fumaroli]
MYCTQCNGLKSRVALAVGNDLSEAELRLLEKQLKNCEQCRSQYEELQQSYEALQKQFDNAPVPSLQDSVWPQVSAKIVARRRRNRPTQFNFLLPTLTTVACCLALLLVTNSPQTDPPAFTTPVGSPHPVGLLGNNNLNTIDNNFHDLQDQQWGAPDGLLKANSNPFGYNLPRLRHDMTNTSNLHSVKF